MSSRYSGGGCGSSRRAVPSYQTSSSSRNYSSTGGGALERDYSRSHLSGNGGSSANYFSSASSRKPESSSTGGYSYLEPNWIDKTRSSIPVDPYASNYLDRAPLSTSRDYTTAAAAAAASQPVYPSAAAAALSVGAYPTNSSMPKAYARADDYYRASTAALAPPYGYSSAFEQSTMAAQAAAIYEMQNSKRDAWPAPAHAVEYSRREDDRGRGSGERRRDEGRRGDERRVEERRPAVAESWRDRDRGVVRDRDRRPVLPSRERERERDLRVTVSSSTRRGGDDHREVRRAEPPAAAAAARGGGSRHDHTRDRDARDTSRRSIEKRSTTTAADSRLDRESRELERQLAKVQRELEQLESGRKKGSSRERSKEKEKESERPSRRPAVSSSSSAPARRAASPPARSSRVRPPPPRRAVAPPPTRSSMTSSSTYHRAAVRPSRGSMGGRNSRPSAVLPSLLDAVVPRPGRRSATATRGSRAWEASVSRRGPPAPPPRAPATKRAAGHATKRGTSTATRPTARREFPAVSSREKVRRAKEKLRREEERRKRNEKRKELRQSKEHREKRKEEDFAWLETIMSEDEELDEETNRKLLLVPRQRRVIALVDRAAVHPQTLANLEERTSGDGAEESETELLWTAEEADAIELLPIIDQSLVSDVSAAFLAAHPDPTSKEEATEITNGDGKDSTMEE